MLDQTVKERILCALHHEEGDRVPIWDYIDNRGIYEYFNPEGDEDYARGMVRVYHGLGIDLCRGYGASYSLDQDGRHKARLFGALLGMSMDDAQELRDLLLQVARTRDAEIGKQDEHGQRYRIDFLLTRRGRQATLRSVWNVRPNEDFPRFVTCYPIKEAGL